MILVVEDNRFVRKFILRVLRPEGYRIFDAACGEEAVQLFKEKKGEIDLLVTDIMMPGMNGRELAETLKSMHEDIKVLFMSGYTGEILIDKGILQPGDSVITKPVLASELRERVRGCFAIRNRIIERY